MIRAATALAILAVLWVGVSCKPAGETPPAGPSAGVGETVPPSTTKKSKDPCAKLATEFNQVLAEAKTTCETDADCACREAGIGPTSDCGGIVDKGTADRLGAIADRFRGAGCFRGFDCAPWACIPVCRSGVCGNSEDP